MKALFISGSPRKRSNTDYLLEITRSVTGGDFIKLSDYSVNPCNSCRACLKLKECVVKDDMKLIYPMLFESDVIVLGSPVYFNNVSAQMKAFMGQDLVYKG